MPEESEFVHQGPGTPGAILSALVALLSDEELKRLRGAVAFASRAGVRLMLDAVEAREAPLEMWWVIGLDGAVTEPAGLRLLKEEVGDQLRVLRTAGADAIFHSKVIVIDDAGDGATHAVVGSANLTAHGLGRNVESVLVLHSLGEEAALRNAEWGAWWDEIWMRAVPLDEARLVAYEAWYRTIRRRIALGDRLVAVEVADADERVDVDDPSEATALWLDAGAITGGAGNQLELPQAVVAFFGIPQSERATDKYLTLIAEATDYGNNHLMFYANNDMWRININTNIVDVFGSRRDRTVLFTREDRSDTYTFRILSGRERAAASAVAVESGRFGHTPTREYGWY